ncbi:MAG: hypothetical protein RBT81_12535 [Gammaproteobacteria bacterium]|nr:hypothetical protein [Gammaproteobacteria bacterium]
MVHTQPLDLRCQPGCNALETRHFLLSGELGPEHLLEPRLELADARPVWVLVLRDPAGVSDWHVTPPRCRQA